MISPGQKLLIGLIVAMVTIFVAQLISFGAMANAMAFPSRIELAWEHLRAGEATATDWQSLSTLITAAFMHGGWDHILFNMLFLWIFAGLIVDLMGWRWMLGLFFATAIAGSIGDVLLRSGSDIPALGASGAVMGFEGAYLGLAVRWKLPWPHIFPMAHPIPPARLGILAVVGFILDISGMIGPGTGVAHGAHLGGFITGLFLTSFVAPRPRALPSR